MEENIEKLSDKVQKNRVNPYKGLYPYEEKDTDIFYGRTDEAEKLFQLIRLNPPLTIVLGKAGIGRTARELGRAMVPLLRPEDELILFAVSFRQPEKSGPPGLEWIGSSPRVKLVQRRFPNKLLAGLGRWGLMGVESFTHYSNPARRLSSIVELSLSVGKVLLLTSPT